MMEKLMALKTGSSNLPHLHHFFSFGGLFVLNTYAIDVVRYVGHLCDEMEIPYSKIEVVDWGLDLSGCIKKFELLIDSHTIKVSLSLPLIRATDICACEDFIRDNFANQLEEIKKQKLVFKLAGVPM